LKSHLVTLSRLVRSLKDHNMTMEANTIESRLARELSLGAAQIERTVALLAGAP